MLRIIYSNSLLDLIRNCDLCGDEMDRLQLVDMQTAIVFDIPLEIPQHVIDICKLCKGGIGSTITSIEPLKAHDSAIVKEFVEKIDSWFLSKATPVSPRKEYDEWVIAKQDWNKIVAHIRDMAEGKDTGQ